MNWVENTQNHKFKQRTSCKLRKGLLFFPLFPVICESAVGSREGFWQRCCHRRKLLAVENTALQVYLQILKTRNIILKRNMN